MKEQEMERLHRMQETETELRNQGYALIAGVDEAGRGPLAGDVYAAAVILPEGAVIEGLNDSKKLSEKKREALFDVICSTAISYGIGRASVEEIDTYNILQATFLAMNRAVAKLSPAPDFVLIDGNRMEHMTLPHRCVIKGDANVSAIAAASVLAKVSRDRYISELDAVYPEYQFGKHKGYGTKVHVEALKQYGPCPIHRKSFLTKILG